MLGFVEQTRDDYFRLDDSFIDYYRNSTPDFGFNGLGELVFYRTYSRLMSDGRKESFADTVRRVVEGCYEIQRRHQRRLHLPWSYEKAQVSAQEMFRRIWCFKFTPPGRGLWMMGTDFMWERGGAALNSCGYVSTYDKAESDPAEPFCFLMDMSMLGVGIGFDTLGAMKIRVDKPSSSRRVYVVPDSREGWVESVRQLIHSYTVRSDDGVVDFDYSEIRPAGTPINGFGGKASGPDVLCELHKNIRKHLDSIVGDVMTSTDIVDIMNYIGALVVAGNVRRSSEIALGDADDIEYCAMKSPTYGLRDDEIDDFNYIVNNRTPGDPIKADHCFDPEKIRNAVKTWDAMITHRWVSNNSVFADVGMDYTDIAKRASTTGEPGLIWLDNIRNFGRMVDGRQPGIDARACGTNPCSEQSLESYEMCNLVETFPAHHDTPEDYMRTLKYAYLYGKTITLLPTHNSRTNQVMLRNRRIGVSQSGIAQAFAKFGRRRVLAEFCDRGYREIKKWDKIYSEWLCVPNSIKVTSVKPSGSVSLLAGATPGIHYPEATNYWRRIRLAKHDVLVEILREAGYHIEDSITDGNTVVVKFAVSCDVKPVSEVSIWEQVKNAVDLQRYWADNQVSCTIRFKDDEASQISRVLECYEDSLKSISFLPISNHGYSQLPYEACSSNDVVRYNASLLKPDYTRYIEEAVCTKYCDSDRCELQLSH